MGTMTAVEYFRRKYPKGYIFEVPPGLGDISWCYIKLKDLTEKAPVGFLICNDPPLRSLDFVDLLPGVHNLGYGRSYSVTRKELLPYNTDLTALKPGQYCISMNPHLEAGKRIEKAFPLQQTHYHFQIDTTEQHVAEAKRLLSKGKNPLVGFYCSSYKHRPDLGFWDAPEWLSFLKLVYADHKDITFVAIGATWDDKTKKVVDLCRGAKLPVISTVGETHVGTTIEMLRRLDYFFAFPSGLAIFCDVLRTPCWMWYWSNVAAFSEFKNFPNSYADPETIADNRHVNAPYLDFATTYRHFKQRGAKWLPA